MSALISCIIPVYNGERFLSETIASVLAQSYLIDEIIVVDDGSTDGTRKVVEEYRANLGGQVHYLWQENGGSAKARNAGIQAATGELLAFLDADDLWLPTKTARQVERFRARPELGISVTHIQNFWMEEVRAEEERMRDDRRALPVAGYQASTVMIRRQIFEQIGLFDSSFQHADCAEWFMRAREAGVIDELLPDLLAQHRMHLDNFSRKAGDDSRKEYLRLLHKSRARQRTRSATAT